MNSIIEQKNEYIRKNNWLNLVLKKQEELLVIMSKTMIDDVKFLIRETEFKIKIYTPMAIVSGIGTGLGIFLSLLNHKPNSALYNLVFFILSIFSLKTDMKRKKSLKETLAEMRKVKNKPIEVPTKEVLVGYGEYI